MHHFLAATKCLIKTHQRDINFITAHRFKKRKEIQPAFVVCNVTMKNIISLKVHFFPAHEYLDINIYTLQVHFTSSINAYTAFDFCILMYMHQRNSQVFFVLAYFCSDLICVAVLQLIKVYDNVYPSSCLPYSKQYNQHKTHLDGGKHKVHGCTLSWSQTSGFLSSDMFLEGYQIKSNTTAGRQVTDVFSSIMVIALGES